MNTLATIPELDADPILRLIAAGEAGTLEEAEELYLDRSLPEISRLIGSAMSDDELMNHPLMVLLRRARKSRLGGFAGVTPDSRLAAIVAAMERVGLTCLVMGGHAVRYYGLARNTNDFDLHLAPEAWESLLERLVSSGLSAEPVIEGPSWRPQTFRRFLIGRLPDGREGMVRVLAGKPPLAAVLRFVCPTRTWKLRRPGSAVSSVAGFDSQQRDGTGRRLARRSRSRRILGCATSCPRSGQRQSNRGSVHTAKSERVRITPSARPFSNVAAIREALSQVRASISQAFLLPLAADATIDHAGPAIEPLIAQKLRTIQPGSSMHFLLVEAVRRQYKVAAQAADRADKESIRATQTDPPARL